MGIDNEFMKLIGSGQQQGMSEAEAKILSSLFNEDEPLYKSELKQCELVPFIACKTFAEIYGLELYKKFLIVFLKSKVPLDRKRVNEVIKAMRREQDEEKKSLWDRIRNK